MPIDGTLPHGGRALLAALALGSTAAALAQESAAAVTDEQVKAYQIGLEAGCRRVGRSRGESPEQIDAYCGCVMRVLRDNATPAQWQQAAFSEKRRLPREEALALSEHTLKFQACRAKGP